MSDDDVNRLTPDDGDLNEVVVVRLRSALLDDVVVSDTERDHTVASVLEALDNESEAPVVNISRDADSDQIQFCSSQLPSSLSPSALERYSAS